MKKHFQDNTIYFYIKKKTKLNDILFKDTYIFLSETQKKIEGSDQKVQGHDQLYKIEQG